MHFKTKNDLLQVAELKQIVRAICRILSKIGKASLRGIFSLKLAMFVEALTTGQLVKGGLQYPKKIACTFVVDKDT